MTNGDSALTLLTCACPKDIFPLLRIKLIVDHCWPRAPQLYGRFLGLQSDQDGPQRLGEDVRPEKFQFLE